MKLTIEEIEICRRKCGKGSLMGFEKTGSLDRELSEEEADRVFDRLAENGLIEIFEDSIRLSAFGHFLISIMSEPEQFIMLENPTNGTITRLYLRNAYYLCVIEYKNAGRDRLILELLPDLKQVVGSFVFALQKDGKTEKKEELRVTARSWNKEGAPVGDLMILGGYEDNRIRYQMTDTVEDPGNEKQEEEIYEVVNRITAWLLGRIAETIREKSEVRYEKVR